MEHLRSTQLWRTALAGLFAGLTVAAGAAERDAPVHRVDGSFVREWLILGPFPSREMETDFLADAGGEANVRPKEGDTVTRSDGTQLKWTRLSSDYDIVSIEKALGSQTWSVAYAYCELSPDRSMETNLRPAASSSLLWLNGMKVVPPPVLSGGPSNVPVAYPIQLNAGPNPCLLKLGIGQWECVFSMQPLPFKRATAIVRVTDPEGRPIPGALVQFYDQGERVWSLRTGGTGQAEACLYPLAPTYDLRVTLEGAGAWLNNVALQSGEQRDLNVVLSPSVSISGRALAMDGSPQNAIVVQALRDPDSSPDVMAAQQHSSTADDSVPSLLPLPPFSETVLSDTNGNFRFVNLRPGAYRLRGHGPDGFVYPNGGQEASSAAPLIVAPGRTNETVQFVFPEAKKGVWQHYRITKELIELGAVSVHRTPDGLLWVGTEDGTLHAYDGVDFKIFQAGQVPGGVHVIHDDAMGTVWIGTSGGMSRNGNGQFQPLPFNDSLPRKQVFGILTDSDGSVLFGTPSGLYRYNGGKLSTWTVSEGLPSNNTGPLIYARDGAVWVGTSTGLARFDGQSISVPLVFPFSIHLGVSKLHQAQDGAIWFCSTTGEIGGAFRLEGSALRRLGTEDGLPSEQVYDIAETSDGHLWFATESGLSRFNGKTIVNYRMGDGLSNASIRDIFVDDDDVLWLANGAGVSRFDPKHISSFTQRDGLQTGSGGTPSVFSIEPHADGGFWVGTQWGGVFRIIPQASRPAVESVYPQLGYVRQIHRPDDGTLWFATASGLYKLLDGVPTQVLSRDWMIALTSDDQGRLWYGNGWNGGGVSRYDPRTGQEVLFTRAHGLPDDQVWDLEWSPGNGVWIGTGAGLALAKGETIEDAGGRLGLPDAAVRSIQRDADGTLRVSSSRGLYTSDGKKSVSITAAAGLPDQQVWSSERTPDGIIWIASDSSGLIGYDGKATTVLDKRDGLPGNRLFVSASDADGSLWCGFLDAGGLSRFQRSRSRPSVRLLQATVGDNTFTNSSKLPRTETGRLVAVTYQEIDLKTHPEKRQFYYRLTDDSGETAFSGVTKERRFQWTPRQGGTYTFEVQAIDRDLNYSEPARLAFRAFVPWYANAWITVPGGGTFGGLVIWAFIARAIYLRQRREAERLREQMLRQERQARETLEERSRQLEEKTRQLEAAKDAADTANRAKSAFLANMSHEIRTPLNAILGYAQILRRKPGLPAEDRAAVKTIEASGDHLLTMINSVLDLSKIEAGSMEQQSADFDLAQVIHEVAAMFQMRCQEKGLVWRVEFDREFQVPSSKFQVGTSESGTNTNEEALSQLSAQTALNSVLVHGDEGKLRQVLINLLGNAVKFTEQGAVVLRVEVRNQLSVIGSQSSAIRDPLPAPVNRAPPITEHRLLITFAIIDTGPGIPPDAQDKLFAPFVQVGEGARKGGTGLGLAISKRLVELMGGTIGLQSTPGQGAMFHFTVAFLPASGQASDHVPLESKEPSRLAAGFRVNALVVDDVEENRQVLCQILSSLGCQVRLAESGPRALELIRVQAPEIVFTDIRMPEMSGLELRNKIVEEFGASRMRIVAISASVLAHEQRHYLGSGFDDFIGKPFRVARVAACLVRLLSVEFEYEASGQAEATLDPAASDSVAPVSIPASLLERLRTSAQAYQVVEFSRCLAEVEQLGAEGRRVAAALEILNQDGEQEKILEILDQLEG